MKFKVGDRVLRSNTTDMTGTIISVETRYDKMCFRILWKDRGWCGDYVEDEIQLIESVKEPQGPFTIIHELDGSFYYDKSYKTLEEAKGKVESLLHGPNNRRKYYICATILKAELPAQPIQWTEIK